MYHVTKCKLHPKKRHIQYFEQNIGSCRWVYNHCLQYCIDHYDRNKDKPKEEQERRPGAYDLQGLLPALKKDHEWLKLVDSQALKYSAAMVDQAFKNFFRRLKSGEKPGFPRFKSKYRSRPSFTLTQGAYIDYGDNYVKLPKIGNLKIDKTNFNPPADSIKSRVKRATISRSPSGNYYISILFEDDRQEPEENHQYKRITALDLGIKHLFRADNLDKRWNIESPRFLRDEMKRLKREQKKLSKKTVRSHRWIKQKCKVARLHEKIRNSRRYFFHLLANELISNSDALVMEKLDIRGMIEKTTKEEEGNKKRNINRAFYDQAIGDLVNIISYKSRRNGKPLYLADTLRAPNKTCSHCDHMNDFVTLYSQQWKCENCDKEHSRSDNCLINLHRIAAEMSVEIQALNDSR